MKNTLLLFLGIFIFTFGNSQSWVDMMQDPNSNFYDVQQAFEEYWQNREIERGKGWKQFKRWEYFMEPRVFPSGNRFSPSKVYQEYTDYMASHPQQRSLTGQWQYIGNNNVPATGGGAGRINCLAFRPGNTNVIYAGAPAGGLWITENGGTTWTTYTDQLASIGVSAIAIHPNNPDTIYIGTGDGDAGDTYSVGILKSTDGGISFQTTGLSFNYNSGITIRKLIINPTNPDILIAATSNGIYKTSNAGSTWTQTATGGYYDLEFKPGNPNTVYTVTNGKFWISTNGGDTFTQVTNGLPSGINTAGRMAIGVTPANSNYVYILTGLNTDYGYHGIYRSTDSGNSFTLRSDSPNILGWSAQGTDEGGQAWYDLAIVVSPTNANLLWTGGVNVWKSTNGGTNWVLDAHWYGDGGQPYVHADIHAMEFVPGTSGSFLIGCDGGVFKTTNSGSNYSDISNNLKIAQIYKFSQSVTDPLKMISGWQDNGTNLKTPIVYRRVLGGDGMDCIMDHTNDAIMYGEYYYGRIYKSTDNGISFDKIVDSDDTLVSVDEKGEWVTPYIMHPTDQNTLLVGKSQVFRSIDGGDTWTQVGSVSGGSGMVIGLAYAPSNPDYIYAIKRNRVFASTDGNTFTDRTSGLPTSASFTNITVDPNNPLRVWLTYSGFSTTNKVYYSANGGLSWSNYGTGIPNIPVNCIVYENGSNDGLYIGTDMGVFYRNASLTSWQYFSDGLPNTIVNDMEIFYAGGKIRAATYGRGIWESDLYTNVQNDAGIALVTSPIGNVCNTVFSPVVTLKNFGDNDLTSVILNFEIDAVPATPYHWNGMLHPGEEVILTLPLQTAVLGSHAFNIYTSDPNGVNDSYNSNDTLQNSFVVINTGNEITVTLDLDCYGEEISWNIGDGSSTLIFEIPDSTYEGNATFPATGGIQVSKSICLDAGCYDFTITDEGGNGLNGIPSGCSVNGTYQATDAAGTILFQDATSDGNFGNSVTHNFCVAPVYAASFTATPTTICSGQTVQFSDVSTSGTNSWNWSFPGGTPSTSTLQNPTVTYVAGGTYDVTLQSGDGTNTNTKTIIGYILVYDSPMASVIFDSVACFGDCDGNIDLTVTGGTLPLRFAWSNGSSNEDVSSLCAGNYSILVSDDNGCRDSMDIIIYSPSQIQLNLSATQATCGVSDGSVNSAVTGGISPYDLLWSTGDTGSGISGLGIGSYTLSVTDGNDCVVMQSVAVSNPNAPDVSATSINETCGGECDGALQSFASGGTGTLNYVWSNGAGTTDTITSMCPGTFIISVTDQNSCEDRDTVIVAAGTPYPVANFNVSNTTVGLGSTVNFVNLSTGANQHSWNFGDGGTSTFSSTSHLYDSLGTFMVVLVSCKNNCCDSDTAYINVIDISVVAESNLDGLVHIYPNPADEQLQIEFLKGTADAEISLFDNSGKLVWRQRSNSSNARIDLSGFSQGIYIVEVGAYDTVLKYKLVKK